jgi:hypothetical protein
MSPIISNNKKETVLECLSRQAEETRTLTILNHGTSVHEGKPSSLYDRYEQAFDKDENEAIMQFRGVGSNPHLSNPGSYNLGIAVGDKGVRKRVKALINFLKESEEKACLPKKINLCGYSRGAITAIRQAQEIYKIYGDEIEVNLTLIAPCIGPLDELTEKDLWLPPNVQSALITLSGEENRTVLNRVLEEIDPSKIPFDSSKTTVTAVAVPGTHDGSPAGWNQEKGRERKPEFELNRHLLLLHTHSKSSEEIPEPEEISEICPLLDQIYLNNRPASLFSSIADNSNLPEHLQTLHENLREAFLIQQEARDVSSPVIKDLKELKGKLEGFANTENPFKALSEILQLARNIQKTMPGNLPNKVFETIQNFKEAIFLDKNEEKALNLIEAYIRFSDKRQRAKPYCYSSLKRLFEAYQKCEGNLGKLCEEYQRIIERADKEFTSHQKMLNSVEYSIENLEELNEGLNFAAEGFNTMLNELKEKVENKEEIPIEEICNLLNQYSDFIDAARAQKKTTENQSLKKILSTLLQQFKNKIQSLFKNPRLSIDFSNSELQELRDTNDKLKNLNESHTLNHEVSKALQRGINLAYIFHAENEEQIIDKLFTQLNHGKSVPKGIEYNGSKATLDELFERNPEMAKALFQRLIQETDPKIFRKLIKHKHLESHLETFYQIIQEDKENQFSKEENESIIKNILTVLELSTGQDFLFNSNHDYDYDLNALQAIYSEKLINIDNEENSVNNNGISFFSRPENEHVEADEQNLLESPGNNI